METLLLCLLWSGLLGAAPTPAAPLLSWDGDGRPQRFGIALPREVLDDGLSLAGCGSLQWRRLPIGRVEAAGPRDLVWIELAVVAPRGRLRLMRAGQAAHPDGSGPAFVLEESERRLATGVERLRRWRWCDGTVDERRWHAFTVRATVAGETYEVGEVRRVESAGMAARARYWCSRGANAAAVQVGLLPASAGRSRTSHRVQKRLIEVVPLLLEMPGERGAGDFVRAGDEVSNNEFDTGYALLRCATALADERALALARRCAFQLVDRDLDSSTGLPFVHGADHRAVAPQAGHVWLEGLLWTSLLTADDDGLQAARALSRALVARLPDGVGRDERMRDFASPLRQLEVLLQFEDHPLVRRAADRYAAAIALRYDEATATFRFGEGRCDGGAHFERGWLSAGLLLPALRLHLLRRPEPELLRCVAAAEGRLRQQLGRGCGGLPTHWRVDAGGRVYAEHREFGTARAAWLLEAVPPRELHRLLDRSGVRRALDEVPALDDADLPTAFTLLARCDWVWR